MKTYRLTGGCMRPLLNQGEFVFIDTGYDRLCPGDLVLYELAGQKFLHRIWRVKTGRNGSRPLRVGYPRGCRTEKSRRELISVYLMKDDTASVAPHWITEGNILGKLCLWESRNWFVRYVSYSKIGYVYSVLTNIIFRFGRIIKNSLLNQMGIISE